MGLGNYLINIQVVWKKDWEIYSKSLINFVMNTNDMNGIYDYCYFAGVVNWIVYWAEVIVNIVTDVVVN